MLKPLIILPLVLFALELFAAPVDGWLDQQSVKLSRGGMPKLAILIDDMGHSLSLNKRALSLPGPVSFAFLPFAPHSRKMALAANKLDRDILLHAPMENIHNIPLGLGGMTADMSEVDFKAVLNSDIDAIPHLIGVNNHMGSELTALKLPMRWTMEVLTERGLFFVDSITTADSVAWRQAREAGMLGIKRDVFLDHQLIPRLLDRQFSEALTRAKTHGYALLIAHPHAMSIDYLARNLTSLEERGVELISLSALISIIESQRAPGPSAADINVTSDMHRSF